MSQNETTGEKQPEQDELLTLAEAVDMLGISKPTMYRLLDQGRLKGMKVGNQWRFRRSDLNAYLDRGPVAMLGASTEELTQELAFFTGLLRDAGEEPDFLTAAPADDADPGENLVIRLTSAIILLAINRRASDIHFEPVWDSVNAYMLRLRIDGVLQEVRRLPYRIGEAVVMRIKIMDDMSLTERDLPQDGRIMLNVTDRRFDLRVSVVPAIIGEAVTMRILSQQSIKLGLDQINLLEHDLERLRLWLARPSGIILFTGPTGSGKSTVMYSALQSVTGEAVKTLSVEDPVEYMLPYVTQVQVKPHINLTFAAVMRAFLRQDPDIIMVGEIRDYETMAISVNAALTGHLLLSVLHAPTAAAAALRLVEMGLEPFLVASSLLGVSAQRLVRRLCPECRQPLALDDSMRLDITRRAASGGYVIPDGTVFYRAVGCPACHDRGYRGRNAIYELLDFTPAVREAILQRASEAELTAIAVREGMRTLTADGLRKAADGMTTIEEVLRVLG